MLRQLTFSLLLSLILPLQAQVIFDSTRLTDFDYACIKNDAVLSKHQRQDKAITACLNAQFEDRDATYEVMSGRWQVSINWDALAQSYPGINNSAGDEPPPNQAPVWNGVPAPSTIEGIGGNTSLSSLCTDPNGDALTYSWNTGSAARPTGVDISGSNITDSGTAAAGTTTGLIIDCSDGIAAPTVSATFTYTIIAEAQGANLIWEGGYETGDYTEWPPNVDSLPANMAFFGVPAYARPLNYNSTNATGHTGNGSLASIVRTSASGLYLQGPVACGTFAGKSVIHSTANSATATGCNGSSATPCECDNAVCTRRRAQAANMVDELNTFWPDALSELNNRRFFFATYIASNWPFSGSSWGNQLMQIKESAGIGSPTFAIYLKPNGTYSVEHLWSSTNAQIASLPWQQAMFYTGNYDGQPYPRADSWPEGTAHFPNIATSHAELQNVNIGGWTYWLVNVRADWRGSDAGGTGYLELWKCDDDEEDCTNSANYTQILDIVPGQTTRGGVTFNHGIFYNNTTNEFGLTMGQYASNSAGIHATIDRVMYDDCAKIGDENSTFSNMLYDINP